MEALQKDGQARDLEKFQTRKWKQGDVYAPHDLTPAEMHKWKTRGSATMDAFDALAINPMNEYKVSVFLVVTSMAVRLVGTDVTATPELFDHVRIHDSHGKDKAFERHRLTASQSKTSCESDQKSYWYRANA